MFSSDLKRSQVEMRKSFSFDNSKGYHKVLSFGSNYFLLITHIKDNSNKKVKFIVVIHICNEFDK